jgi:hypothetical protein
MKKKIPVPAFDRKQRRKILRLCGEKISGMSVPDMISVYAQVAGLDPGMMNAALPHLRKAFAAIEAYQERRKILRLHIGRRVRELERSMEVEDPDIGRLLPAGSITGQLKKRKP